MIDHTAVRNRLGQWATFLYDMHGELTFAIAEGFANPGPKEHGCNGEYPPVALQLARAEAAPLPQAPTAGINSSWVAPTEKARSSTLGGPTRSGVALTSPSLRSVC